MGVMVFVILVSSLLLPAFSAAATEEEEQDPPQLALPEIKGVPYSTVPGLVSVEWCEKMMAAAKEEQWIEANDSVDKRPQHTIDLFDRGEVQNVNLWDILEPELGRIQEMLRQKFPGYARRADWVFLRKYTSGHQRDSLQAHLDVSSLSVIIPLNVDFEGGELFFVRKTSPLHKRPEDLEGIYTPSHPVGPAANTSDYYFPTLFQGVAMTYDNSVWHGIRPVTSGTKYSLVLFYDMKKQDFSGQMDIKFFNRRRAPSELYFESDYDEEILEVQAPWEFGHVVHQGSYAGHKFIALDKETKEIVGRVRIELDTLDYVLLDEHERAQQVAEYADDDDDVAFFISA